MKPESNNEQGVTIIAEAGVNHNGDVALAMRLIEGAKECGADAVKFQTWITDRVYSKEKSIKPEYQKAGTDGRESEYDTIKRLEISFDSFRILKRHADAVGIEFLSTPDERESADFLVRDLRVPLLKVSSQDVNNLPFLRYLGAMGVPILLSTGTATLAEVAAAVETLRSAGCREPTLLHCTSCYPAPPSTANLRAIATLREAFKLPVGYSDHTEGIEVACAAVALGACVLEKHFTLSRSMPGPDQQAALEPAELKRYVLAVRNVVRALGSGRKEPCPEELPNRQAMRRFLVAARPLSAGHRIQSGDLLLKKVASGLSPSFHDLLIGATARRPIAEDERITLDMLEFPAEPPR
jgi:sialic acid synthase SpsE